MRKLDCAIWLMVCCSLLTGCGNYSPAKHASMKYSKLVSEPDENVLYDAIDLQYWLDNRT